MLISTAARIEATHAGSLLALKHILQIEDKIGSVVHFRYRVFFLL